MRGNEKYFYTFIFLLLAGMIYVSWTYFRGSGKSVVGVAVAKSHKINSEEVGRVVHIHVIPGQQIETGDTLVALASNYLEIESQKVGQRLEQLYRERAEKDKLLASEVASVRAQTEIDIAEIRSEITRLEQEASFNRRLASAINNDRSPDSLTGPVSSRVKSLELEIGRHREAMEIELTDVRQEHRSEMESLAGQIQLYEREMKILEEKRKRLNVMSSTEGVVENVYVRDGESTEPFTPLLTIRPNSPTSVVGYASLPVRASWSIGDEVRIRTEGGVGVPGRVIGFGEVVALPEVLQQSTAVKAFGREIFIEIAPGSPLASGEKVLIR